MKLKTQTGAKTFIFGEYAALMGGSALVAVTPPEYEMQIEWFDEKEFSLVGLHPESPAGRLLSEKIKKEEIPVGRYSLESLKKTSLPGFGSSTAEYLCALALIHQIQSKEIFSNAEISPRFFKIKESQKSYSVSEADLDEYRLCASAPNQVWAPSGYDLLAQAQGGLVRIKNSQAHIEAELMREFQKKNIAFFSTGEKKATHEVLKTHFLKSDLQDLARLSGEIEEALLKNFDFAEAIQRFGQAMIEKSLVAPQSLNLLSEIKKNSKVKAAKACGAMGADVILVVGESDYELRQLESLGLKWVADSRHLAFAFNYERIA